MPDINNTEKKKKVKLLLKNPTQERSKQTVSIILKACEKILLTDGFFGVTTDKIAKEAGVSIGSLYQFFGNKESVVSALVQNLLISDQEKFLNIASEMKGLSLDQRIEKVVESAVDLYENNFLLRRKLQNIQAYLSDQTFYREIIESYEKQLLQCLPGEPTDVKKARANLLVEAFFGIMDRAILEKEKLKDNEVWKSELKLMLRSYLNSSGASAERAS